jgi:poly(A) polymerase
LDLLLQKLQHFFRERALECYLVGGSLRDLLLNQRPQDIDLAVRGEVEPVARALAKALRSLCIPLNQEKGVMRVILPKKPYGRLIIDLSPLHGETILDDLAQRDFTINALALSLEDATTLTSVTSPGQQAPAPLIDPLQGWCDLQSKTLRLVHPDIFQKDAIRLLRAIRLSASRQLSIDPAAEAIIRRDAPLLGQASPERIRDELLQMLAWPQAIAASRALDHYHMFSDIFPNVPLSGNSPTQSSQQTSSSKTWPTLTALATLFSASYGETNNLEQAEQQRLAAFLRLSHRPAFKKHWKKAPGGAIPRAPLLLLAALLTDLLQSDTTHRWSAEHLQTITSALKRLTLGRKSITFLVFLLQESTSPWHMEPRPLTNSSVWAAARHYFDRFGERGIDLAVFRLACWMATCQEPITESLWQSQAQPLISLIEAYYDERNAITPPMLLDGDVIITRFGIKKGPAIGAILAKVRSAQLDGLIHTRAQAIQFITEHYPVANTDNKNGALPEPIRSQQTPTDRQRDE